MWLPRSTDDVRTPYRRVRRCGKDGNTDESSMRREADDDPNAPAHPRRSVNQNTPANGGAGDGDQLPTGEASRRTDHRTITREPARSAPGGHFQLRGRL